MAVVKFGRKTTGDWSGNHDSGPNEYFVTYKAITDDKLDGPQQVLDGSPGDVGVTTYGVDNDNDVNSVLIRKIPRRSGPTTWDVVYQFGDPWSRELTPEFWRDEYATNEISIQTELTNAWLDQDMLGTPINRDENSPPTAPVFSQGAPVPRPTYEVRGLQIEHTQYRNQTAMEELVQFLNHVNHADVELVIPQNNYDTIFTFPIMISKTVLCSAIRARQSRINKVDNIPTTITYLYNPAGWALKYADQGWAITAVAGAPDQSGGTWSGSPADGVDETTNKVDRRGNPSMAAGLLDGTGLVLKPTENSVTINWRGYDTKDFTSPLLPTPWLTPAGP